MSNSKQNQKINFAFIQQTPAYLIIGFLMLIYTLFRLNIVKNYRFSFFFDQARDAYISKKIIDDKDIKIQGPSASGTNDTVYHGVIYYYFLAPFYSFSQGNPQIAMNALIIFSSLSVIPIYLLTQDLLKSKTWAFLLSLLYCFSAEQALNTTWLSNPSLGLVLIPFFYYFLWQTFFKQKKKFLLPLIITLGLNIQSAVWLFYLMGSILGGLYYIIYIEKKDIIKFFSPKQIGLSFAALVITLSTMIVTQIKLFLNGIFTLEQFSQASLRSESFDLDIVIDIFHTIIKKIAKTYFPIFPLLSVVFLVLVLINLKNISKKIRCFLAIWLSGPLWLLAFHARKSYYYFTSYEYVALFLFIYLMISIKNASLKKNVIAVFTVIYLFTNITSINFYTVNKKNSYSLHDGVFLHDQVDLIDYTYKTAQGQPFSISTYTNPLGYNTTWAYLYNWHGEQKYDYKPFFLGPTQAGIFAGELLCETQEPKQYHFTIMEPSVSVVKHLEDFLITQGNYGQVIEDRKFGQVRIQLRKQVPTETTLEDTTSR